MRKLLIAGVMMVAMTKPLFASVPLRETMESMSCEVHWYEDDQSFVVIGEYNLKGKIGEDGARLVDGVTYQE